MENVDALRRLTALMKLIGILEEACSGRRWDRSYHSWNCLRAPRSARSHSDGSPRRIPRLTVNSSVIGRLLRTVFLADYFVNPVFRREILRVLNRGEAINALKRLILDLHRPRLRPSSQEPG
jgi:hypothetical protein